MKKGLLKKSLKFILNKNYRFLILANKGKYDSMTDEEFLKKKYQATFGIPLDIKNPLTFNQKLQWLKLYDRNPMYTVLVDKYKVRQYIIDAIGEDYLIPLIGVWDDPGEIDFSSLPNKFVLKCNHNSGLGMCICKDKSTLDIEKVKNNLKLGLKQNYYLTGREWPYKNVPRKIIAEKYMSENEEDSYGNDELKDYKFYCFDGIMKFVMINSDRNSDKPTKADYFDRNYNWLNFIWGYHHADVLPDKPNNFEKMISIAEKLSKGIPHVRVDLYDCDGKIYFGELTFFDGSGFDKIEPIEWDYKIGDMLNLPKKRGN